MELTNQPLVTVIVPIYNRPHLLDRSLGSALAQTERDIEILVIDDHSDKPLDDEISRYQDPRIQLIRLKQRSGVSHARNTGIQRARAPFVALLDSDDSWQPDKLKAQMAFMAEHPGISLVHTEEIWIRNGRRVNPRNCHRKSGGNIFGPSLYRCLISPSAVLLRRSAFDMYGLFDTSLPVCEDYDLWLRITSREEVGFLQTPLTVKYGGHADQLSNAYPAMDRYRVQSMMKLLQNVPLSPANQKEILEVIRTKATILLQGAMKRQLPEAALYRQWLVFADSQDPYIQP